MLRFATNGVQATGGALVLASLLLHPVHAADYAGPVPVVTEPLVADCRDGVPRPPWASVWLRHFSGGRPVPTAYGTVLDWRDEKLCFPDRASCNAWIRPLRRDYSRPEGYWTCMPIR
jgi:hypothetical protein